MAKRLTRKTRKKITAIVIFAIMAAIIGAAIYFIFLYEKPEKGDVNEVSIEESVISVNTTADGEKPEVQFNQYDSKLDYEYQMLKNGRAKLLMPIPKGWEVYKYSDYDMVIKAPSDDKYFPNHRIYFHSTLDAEDEITSSYNINSLLGSRILSDRFLVNGREVQIASATSEDDRIIDTDLSDPDAQIQVSYHDRSCRLKGDRQITGLYHQTTAFYWYGIPIALTALTTNDNEEKINDLLLTMMSGCQYERDTLGATQSVDVGDVSFEIPPLYERNTYDIQNDMFDAVTTFICPVDSGTGFSQSCVGVYKMKEKNWEKVLNSYDSKEYSEYFFDFMAKTTYGKNANSDYMTGYIDETMDGSMLFGNQKVNEYVYRYTFLRDSKLLGCFENQQWLLIMYPVKVKNDIYLMTLTTTRGGLPSSFEVIERVAETFSAK